MLPAPSNLSKYQPNFCVWRVQWDSVPGATGYLFADTQGIETLVLGTSFEFSPVPLGDTVDTKMPKWVKACIDGWCGYKALF